MSPMMYSYRLADNGAGGWIVSFPDVPEALTEGNSPEEIAANASDALETALLGYMKDGLDLPNASKAKKGDAVANLSVQTAAKLAFYETFRASGLSKSALARQLGKDEAEVRRMLDPYHATKLPTLEEALRVLGKRMTLVIEAA
jgi:antitoxin HicB